MGLFERLAAAVNTTPGTYPVTEASLLVRHYAVSDGPEPTEATALCGIHFSTTSEQPTTVCAECRERLDPNPRNDKNLQDPNTEE